jgi:prolipoprotein diacylglyceryltransferase
MVVVLQLGAGALMLLAHGQVDAIALLLLPVLIMWYSILLTCHVCIANRANSQKILRNPLFFRVFSGKIASHAPIIWGLTVVSHWNDGTLGMVHILDFCELTVLVSLKFERTCQLRVSNYLSVRVRH